MEKYIDHGEFSIKVRNKVDSFHDLTPSNIKKIKKAAAKRKGCIVFVGVNRYKTWAREKGDEFICYCIGL